LNNATAAAPLPDVTSWRNGRVQCVPCDRLRWVIAHPEAEIVCPTCQTPMVWLGAFEP